MYTQELKVGGNERMTREALIHSLLLPKETLNQKDCRKKGKITSEGREKEGKSDLRKKTRGFRFLTTFFSGNNKKSRKHEKKVHMERKSI